MPGTLSASQSGMRFLGRLYSRLLAWQRQRHLPKPVIVAPDFIACEPSIARDVSRNGVRFYSLCGCCGSRLRSSATLCDECAALREPKSRS